MTRTRRRQCSGHERKQKQWQINLNLANWIEIVMRCECVALRDAERFALSSEPDPARPGHSPGMKSKKLTVGPQRDSSGVRQTAGYQNYWSHERILIEYDLLTNHARRSSILRGRCTVRP